MAAHVIRAIAPTHNMSVASSLTPVLRSAQQAQHAREELRSVVGYSVADEITKLDQLQKAGSITSDEFQRLRAQPYLFLQ